jgi:hypothetical protein
MKRAYGIPLAASLIGLAACAGPACAEPRFDMPQRGPTVEAFIPPGMRVLHSRHADFNRDGLVDVVMVLEQADDEHAMPRPLVVLFGVRGAGYRRSLWSDSMIQARAGGGVLSDAFDEIEIRRNTFVVKHSGGSSTRSGDHAQYRFQHGRWALIGERRSTIRASWDGPEDSLECKGVKLAAQDVCIAHIVDTNWLTGDQIESWHIDDGRVVERRRMVKAGAGRVVYDR